jgi:hypothetical protein
VAVLVKEAKDGTLKVRLIHDLRRSGVNARIKVRERLVLPRIADLVEAILDALERGGPGTEMELFAGDFRDAFKQLRVGPRERKYLTGRGLGGWFSYLTVLFGAGSGPLLWGRSAAAIMRSTASFLDENTTSLQCFVDDPILAVAGSEATRRRTMIAVVLWWAALGTKLSWAKIACGKSVEWIGVMVTMIHGGVKITMPPKKMQGLAGLINEMITGHRGMVKAVKLRSLSGLAAWIGSMLPQLKPFVQQLWAALSAPRKSGLLGMVYYKQIESALEWLLEFASQNGKIPIERVYLVCHRHVVAITMEVDASPWGGGAILWSGPPEGRHDRAPQEYMAITWDKGDESLLQAEIGMPHGQARWEAYMFMLAMRQWCHCGLIGRIVLIGDAEGVISSLCRFSSKDPVINDMAKEIGLWLAPLGLLIRGVHIWGEQNSWADALSRQTVPTQLHQIRCTTPYVRAASSWKMMGNR